MPENFPRWVSANSAAFGMDKQLTQWCSRGGQNDVPATVSLALLQKSDDEVQYILVLDGICGVCYAFLSLFHGVSVL